MFNDAFQILLDGPDVLNHAQRIRFWFETEWHYKPEIVAPIGMTEIMNFIRERRESREICIKNT